MRTIQMANGKTQAEVGKSFDAMGRSWAAYMAGFGAVALAGTLIQKVMVSELAILPTLVIYATVGAVFGLIHLICLGLLTLPLEWARRRKLSDALYRRLVLLVSLLLGAAFPTGLSLMLLPWQAGHDFNFAGHSITLQSLYENWLSALLPCVSGGYFVGRQWGRA